MKEKTQNLSDKETKNIRTEADKTSSQTEKEQQVTASKSDAAPERGGPKGPEPTRFGDWENNGRCTDF